MPATTPQTILQFNTFRNLSEPDATLLARFAQEKKFPTSAPLLRAGQICSHIYLLTTCLVDEVRVDQTKKQLSEGTVIGVEEIIEGKPMGADFIVSQEGLALVIPGTALEELLLLSPTLAPALMQTLGKQA